MHVAIPGRPPITDQLGPAGRGAALGSTSATVTPHPTPGSTTGYRCAALVGSMSLRERVGQLLMVGINSAGPTTAEADI